MSKPKPATTQAPSPIAQAIELDLTAAAAEGRLEPAFEVDEPLAQVCEVLESGRVPVLVGPTGVGKTAIVHELARRVADGGGPGVLGGKTLVQFSLRKLERRVPLPHLRFDLVNSVLTALCSEQGGGYAGCFRDFERALTSAWSRWDLLEGIETLGDDHATPIIAECEERAWDILCERMPGLRRSYVPVYIAEPSVKRLRAILERWSGTVRHPRGAAIEPEAIETAIQLTSRFALNDHQPRIAIDLLREAATTTGGRRAATDADVLERFSLKSRVPRMLIDPRLPLDLGAAEERFRADLLGQSEAVEALLSLLATAKAGLNDARRPLGVFLFVGPTGVGKTHAAQLLAEYVFGGRDRMVRVNMADYEDENSVNTLFGVPEQFSGGHESISAGTLSRLLQRSPMAVVLLDEFEKAHLKVHDRMLQLFDEGEFINGADERINCRSMIFIATSNAGAEVYRSGPFGLARSGVVSQQSLDARVNHAIEQAFRWEFLNRFDRVVHFRPLSREDIRTIALRELRMLRERLGVQQRGLSLEFDESLLDWLAVRGYDPENGARFLKRAVEREVVAEAARLIVREDPPAGATVVLSARGSRVRARLRGVEPPRVTVSLGGAARDPGGRPMRLDDTELASAGATLLERAAPLLARLADHQRRRSELLEQMHASDFWSDRARRAPVLEEFGALDVTTRSEERLSEPILALQRTIQTPRTTTHARAREHLARQVELASLAIDEWLALVDEGDDRASHAVWLVISATDPTQAHADWLEDVTAMELGWCKRLSLAASVAAIEPGKLGPRRVVIAAEGAFARSSLEMEAGLHLRRRDRRPELSVRIDVVPRRQAEAHGAADAPRAERLGQRVRHKELSLAFACDVRCPGREARVRLLAESADLLEQLAGDLAAHAAVVTPDAEPAVARIYGEDGGVARDIRTGAPGVKEKDALRGRLEPLLEAWRAR